jgi:hypothetical protein
MSDSREDKKRKERIEGINLEEGNTEEEESKGHTI